MSGYASAEPNLSPLPPAESAAGRVALRSRERGSEANIGRIHEHVPHEACAVIFRHEKHDSQIDSDQVAQIGAGLAIACGCSCATACVKHYAVQMSTVALAVSGVGLCAVVGFPHGISHPDLIAPEAIRAIKEGATEIDTVANAGKVLGGDWAYVSDELKTANTSSESLGAFVKTSTGHGLVKQSGGDYNYRGATDHHVRLMRRHCGSGVQIKAAGRVRTLDELLRVRTLGVTRIGATATEAVLAEAVRRGYPGPVPAGVARRV
jgi:deoxyribose-phosphate aldolase